MVANRNALLQMAIAKMQRRSVRGGRTLPSFFANSQPATSHKLGKKTSRPIGLTNSSCKHCSEETTARGIAPAKARRSPKRVVQLRAAPQDRAVDSIQPRAYLNLKA